MHISRITIIIVHACKILWLPLLWMHITVEILEDRLKCKLLIAIMISEGLCLLRGVARTAAMWLQQSALVSTCGKPKNKKLIKMFSTKLTALKKLTNL